MPVEYLYHMGIYIYCKSLAAMLKTFLGVCTHLEVF